MAKIALPFLLARHPNAEDRKVVAQASFLEKRPNPLVGTKLLGLSRNGQDGFAGGFEHEKRIK